MKAMKIYSPTQIALGSFWGGSIAAVYFLRCNFLALGKEKDAQKTLVYGIVFNVVLLGILPFLPEEFSKYSNSTGLLFICQADS